MEENKGYVSMDTYLPPLILSGKSLSKKMDYTFNKLLHEVEENFKEKIVTLINKEVGENNWAVYFRMLPDQTGYIAYIFMNCKKDYDTIVSIIDEQIPDVILACPYGGDVHDYLKMIQMHKETFSMFFARSSINYN